MNQRQLLYYEQGKRDAVAQQTMLESLRYQGIPAIVHVEVREDMTYSDVVAYAEGVKSVLPLASVTATATWEV